MLNTFVSLKTAFITDVWWRLKGVKQAGTTTTVHLDPEECRFYFHKLDEFEQKADLALQDHRKLEVVYEDLSEKREEELQRICAFLNVPHHSVSTRLKKQILAPVSEPVDNYSQLKEYFRGTKWSRFFE